MNDSQEFRAHLDARFDRLESKMDAVNYKTITHEQQIHHLQGFSKLVISILVSVCGFLALGYLAYLKGP